MRVKLGGLLISTIMVIFAMSVSLSYAIDENSIVGIWLLDEGEGSEVDDASENGHGGEIVGELDWVEGNFGSALSFPGEAGNYVDIPHDDSLNLTAFSITAWINLGAPGAEQRVLIKGGPTTNYSYYLSTRSGANFAYTGFSTTGMGGWNEAEGTTDVNDGEWHHVAGTYDGGTLRFYVDGEMEAEVDAEGEPFEIENPVTIGANTDGTSPATGIIDDVGLFNVGLIESEVQNIMNSGLDNATGVAPVSPGGKLSTIWSNIKTR